MRIACTSVIAVLISFASAVASGQDYLRELQTRAIQQGHSAAAHWGWDAKVYTLWGSHSNRLIPVYTFGTKGAGPGIDLDGYSGANSPYRNQEQLVRLYGKLPRRTLDPEADYFDQTNLFEIQLAALQRGKKFIFLVIFDGMDWQTTRAASIWNLQRVAYSDGRGTGTHFQDYTAAGTSQFGCMVTSPHSDASRVDVDRQTVLPSGEHVDGGYDPRRGGYFPWSRPADDQYLMSQPAQSPDRHAYTDSASSATSMMAGIKTYNIAINVDPLGRQVATIARRAQGCGYAVGVVSSVPISHATPAAAYAHNVHRNDYQDLTRDLLGLPSISHPATPLAGMDVVIGGGYGVALAKDSSQGKNFVAGNVFLTDADRDRVDVRHGGAYVIAQRTPQVAGSTRLAEAAANAAKSGSRLLGFYGVGSAKGHLPFQTANGDFQPAPGRTRIAERYTKADIDENPTLTDMTKAALTVLQNDPDGFWLMVESGDVDWANHDNNLDNAIGAVNSGDAAVRAITNWVEQHSNWQESLLIVTADHGHYLVLDRPELLIAPVAIQARSASE